MRGRRVKEVVKDVDDIVHVLTGHRIPFWGKWAWEELRSKGTQEVIEAAPDADDPYAILGIDRNARPADIVSRYRELAQEHHPDHGGDVEKFKRMQEAYEKICRERNIR